MKFELWWLLALPLFFALGWLTARIDIKQLLSESRALPSSYFKGLNFLLNEQPDKAIEAFIEVVNTNPQTVELHFALGRLFRQRGEAERAIRMHKNLVERADLAPEKKLNALFELAQDYLKAGLLDRAEEVFTKLQDTSYSESSAKHLIEIYEQEKEWQKAIGVAQRLEESFGKSQKKEVSNFYCELALSEMMNTKYSSARKYLECALAVHRKSVRSSLLYGDLEIAEERYAAAIDAWKRIETQNPAYLSLVAEKMLSAYRQLKKLDEGLNLLRGYLSRYSSLDLLSVVYRATMERHGPEKAYVLVRDELQRAPTLSGLHKLLEARFMEPLLEKHHDLELVKNLVHQHTRNLALYHCDTCGFKAHQFYWRCPACGGWETYSPKRIEERELSA